MPQTLNARGMACPQPILLAKKAMAEADSLIVVVDNQEQAENIAEMAEEAGWLARIGPHPDTDSFQVQLDRQIGNIANPEIAPQPSNVLKEGSASNETGPLVLVIPSETMGRGEHSELGKILIRSFFHTLLEVTPQPQAIIFLNSGVKLVVEGTPILEDLKELTRQGIMILACGTCLGYYDLKEKIAIGTISNMYTIAETMLRAGKIVTL